jgi:anti-sigma regulatory factor (Ser/Thr protein kinase)
MLEDGRSFPLAVRTGGHRTEASCLLPGRSTLLLYTDGLVERRRRRLDAGIARAGAAVQAGQAAAVEELATQVMRDMAPPGGYEDDVALVLYRHPAGLDLTFPADKGELAPARATLRAWLGRCDLSRLTVQDVLVAVGEACANAIEHGYREGPVRHVRLTAEATASRLRLTVADSGRWKEAQPGADPLRGHGITVMRALMHQVSIDWGPAGTTVDMELGISP